MGRDDLEKARQHQRKDCQGRIEKSLKEMTLMDQPYIRDQNITVEELVKQSGNLVKTSKSVVRSASVLGKELKAGK